MAAPVLVGSVTSASNQTGSLTLTAPTGVASGDYQLVVLVVGTGSETWGGAPAGWTQQWDSGSIGGADTCRVAIYTSSTATGSAVFTKSGTRLFAGARAAWRGGTGFDLTTDANGTTATGTTHAIPSQTTTIADSLVIGVAITDIGPPGATNTWTKPSGWDNEDFDNTFHGTQPEDISIGIFSKVAATAGTVTGSATSSVSTDGAVYSVIAVGDPSTPITGTDTQTISEGTALIDVSGSDSQTQTEGASTLSNTLGASDTQTHTDSTGIVDITVFITGSDIQSLTVESAIPSPLVTDSQTFTEGVSSVLESIDITGAPETHTLSEVSSLFITTHKDVIDTHTLSESPTSISTIFTSRTDTQTFSDPTPSYAITSSRTDSLTYGEVPSLFVSASRTELFHVYQISSINFPPIPRRIYGTAEVPEISQEISVVDFFGTAFVIIAYGGTVETVHNLSGSVLED